MPRPARRPGRWVIGATGLAALATVWATVLQPLLIQTVAAAAATHLDQKAAFAVQAEVEPLEQQVKAANAGLKAIILSAIAGLERDIDRLEYIRDQPPPGDWSDELRRQLFETEVRLRVQREALVLIQNTEDGG